MEDIWSERGDIDGSQLTIIGKTIAAGEVLMNQSSSRQESCVRVNRCTFLKGT